MRDYHILLHTMATLFHCLAPHTPPPQPPAPLFFSSLFFLFFSLWNSLGEIRIIIITAVFMVHKILSLRTILSTYTQHQYTTWKLKLWTVEKVEQLCERGKHGFLLFWKKMFWGWIWRSVERVSSSRVGFFRTVREYKYTVKVTCFFQVQTSNSW